MTRLLMLSTLLALAPAAVADDDFSGAWVASLCPPGVQRESGQCANFVLELHQQDDRLCGAHLFSTAGAERIDEGAAPSISGEISNGVVNAIAISGRAPIRVRAEIRKSGATLQWLRQDNPRGDYLLPPSARLTKARKKTLFAPLFEQELKAACSSVFAMAAEAAARQKAQQAAPDTSGRTGTPPEPPTR
ncbi:hypothetical protein [Noviherbaspirillum saxi]|uniref:Invasion protein IalB, involved in pathogenesis n=1 Tax=Noviherbaspirillum saxi TaxID=2320863 RepID=A0A3A3FT80_9BURK|nr:hypothetical protein [Noviherbaspirillum saxi]RJF97401.1 hypothetical protein D3871_01780 [Noviherbaspirillum saxi]